MVFVVGCGRTLAFFGSCKEGTLSRRFVWCNEESAITLVTFAGLDGNRLLLLHERYPSKKALDASMEGGGRAMRCPFLGGVKTG
jgi:hypothetical protein